MTKNTDELDELTELKDVVVDTLGLVTHGANREEFFLLKSVENADGETQETNQVQASVAKSIWQSLARIFKREIEKELAGLEVIEEVIEPVNTESITESIAKELVTEQLEKVAEPKAIEPAIEPELKPELPVAELTKMEEHKMEDEKQVTSEVVIDVEKSNLAAQLAELAKANTDLQARVEKAEQEAAQQRDAREYQVWLTKARSMYTLPASPNDLAEQLHWLAKTDAKRAEWWETHLSALTNQLRDSELFVEKGTSRAAQDGLQLVEKAQKLLDAGNAKSLRDALLSLSRGEQEAYLAEQRRAREVA